MPTPLGSSSRIQRTGSSLTEQVSSTRLPGRRRGAMRASTSGMAPMSTHRQTAGMASSSSSPTRRTPAGVGRAGLRE